MFSGISISSDSKQPIFPSSSSAKWRKYSFVIASSTSIVEGYFIVFCPKAAGNSIQYSLGEILFQLKGSGSAVLILFSGISEFICRKPHTASPVDGETLFNLITWLRYRFKPSAVGYNPDFPWYARKLGILMGRSFIRQDQTPPSSLKDQFPRFGSKSITACTVLDFRPFSRNSFLGTACFSFRFGHISLFAAASLMESLPPHTTGPPVRRQPRQ